MSYWVDLASEGGFVNLLNPRRPCLCLSLEAKEVEKRM